MPSLDTWQWPLTDQLVQSGLINSTSWIHHRHGEYIIWYAFSSLMYTWNRLHDVRYSKKSWILDNVICAQIQLNEETTYVDQNLLTLEYWTTGGFHGKSGLLNYENVKIRNNIIINHNWSSFKVHCPNGSIIFNQTLWFTIRNLPGDIPELGLPGFLYYHPTGPGLVKLRDICLGSITREIDFKTF